MNYKVLYRKYRPNTFDSIIGQDYIVKTLKNSIINNCISHAYIFSGPRGTGKTSTAKVFAKAINCEKPVDGSPCGKCTFCQNYLENPDIIEIDAASNNGVDEIRNLIDNIKLAPTNGKYKVYIIDEVHMLTTSAFNALLLTLEEPPAHTIFILATTNVENVPITILSRCQRFDFQKISITDLIKNLKDICDKEKIAIEYDALEEIASLAEGGMRDALSILDQLSKSQEKITLELVEKEIKTISNSRINEILNSLEENNPAKFLDLMNGLRSQAVDYKNLIKKLIVNISHKAKLMKLRGERSRLIFLDYKNLILKLSEALTKININVDPFTIIEMIFLEYFKDIPSENVENSLNNEAKDEENISKVEKSISKSITNVSAEFISTRINNCFVNAKKEYLENCKKSLSNIEVLNNVDGKIKSIIIDTSLVAASDKNLIFTASNEHAKIEANSLIKEIEIIFKKILNTDYKIIFITNDEWKIKKQEYIENIKIGKKYEYINNNEIVESENSESKELEINDIFDVSKVEVV